MPRKKSTSVKKSKHSSTKPKTGKSGKKTVKKVAKKAIKKTKKKVIKLSVFAIIKTGGKQYKVKERDIIRVDKLEAKEGKEIEFSEVLLLVRGNEVKVGTPFVSKVRVKANVLEQGKDKKIIVLKYKPKKRYRKTYGHRQKYTELEIKKILTK